MPARVRTRTSRPARRPAARQRSMPAGRIPVVQEPTQDQIAQRAYEIFVARGCTPGSEEADWHQAEAELRGRLTLFGRP